jgi:hypothetical protein
MLRLRGVPDSTFSVVFNCQMCRMDNNQLSCELCSTSAHPTVRGGFACMHPSSNAGERRSGSFFRAFRTKINDSENEEQDIRRDGYTEFVLACVFAPVRSWACRSLPLFFFSLLRSCFGRRSDPQLISPKDSKFDSLTPLIGTKQM